MNRPMQFLRLAAALALSALPADVGAQARPRPVGIVAGVVRDGAGEPVADARVNFDGTSRAGRTGADGRFEIADVPAGNREIIVRKLGYQPVRAVIPVIADSAVGIAITIMPQPRALPGVVVQAQIFNQIVGQVVTEADVPLEGVTVDLIGSGRKYVTADDGRFVFVDVAPGNYLMQFRKSGYLVAQRAVQMIAHIDRDMTQRMRMGSMRGRMSAEQAEIVALESERRQGMAGGRAAIIGRDELEKFERAPLSVALAASSAADIYREIGGSCVIVDGFDPVTVAPAGADRAAAPSPNRGPTSFGVVGAGGRGGTVTRTTVVRTPGAAPEGGWLGFFRANEIELVELYPAGSENSRTLCGRFSQGSGCACPPDPAGIVIWLRR